MRKIIVLCSLFLFGCNGGSSSSPQQQTVSNENTQQQTSTTEKEVSSIHITYSPISGTSEPKISYQSSLQFTATAYYDDSSVLDISEQVKWISSEPSVGTITNAGMLKGVSEGVTIISAQFNGVDSSAVDVTVTDAVVTHVQITPKSGNAGDLPVGVTLPMIATGTFSDNTQQELLNNVTWSSSNGAVARRVHPGVVKGINKGSAKVTAQFNGITSNTIEITVTDAIVTKLQVNSPSGNSNIPAGFTQPMTVTGLFSDNIERELSASDVSWSTADTSVATVGSNGIIKGISEGSTTISTQYNGFEDNPIESDPLAITITDATLTEITITSSVGDVHNLVKGNNLQLIATGVFSDGSNRLISKDVSWLSNDESIAIVDNSGSIHAIKIGRTVISAEMNSIKTEFTIDIDDVPVSFYVTKPTPYGASSNVTTPSQNNQIIARDNAIKLIYKRDDRDKDKLVVSVTDISKNTLHEYVEDKFLLHHDAEDNIIGFAGYVKATQSYSWVSPSEKDYITFFIGHTMPNVPASNKTYSGEVLYTSGPEDNAPKTGNMSIYLDEKNPSCLIKIGSEYLKCDISSGVNYDNGEFVSRVVYNKDNSYYGVLEANFYGESGEFATGYIHDQSSSIVDIFLLSSK